MTAHGRKVLATVTLLAIVGSRCSGRREEKKGNHQIWFMGSIYDGATGMIVNGYEISLTYGTTTIRGKVDGNGRYTVGPLPAWNDYAITISAPYYRPFVSYNAGIAPPTPPPASQASDVYNSNTSQTFNFDAYVFPAASRLTPLTDQHSQDRRDHGAGRGQPPPPAHRPIGDPGPGGGRHRPGVGERSGHARERRQRGLHGRHRSSSIRPARLRRHVPGARSTAWTATSPPPRPCAPGCRRT